LKSRGLDGGKVTLGMMDGLPGLETVFREEFPQAKVQRCQVHVARNVLAKVPKKFKQAVANDLRSIFYAPSREKSWECFEGFRQRWQKSVPSAVECLERSIDACLTFFNFPGGMDFVTDNQHHRAAEQRVQAPDQGHGDRCRRDSLLSHPGLYIFENGIALEVNPYRKSA